MAFMHLSDVEEMVPIICRQEVTACFTSASVASRARNLLPKSSKEMDIPGPPPHCQPDWWLLAALQQGGYGPPCLESVWSPVISSYGPPSLESVWSPVISSYGPPSLESVWSPVISSYGPPFLESVWSPVISSYSNPIRKTWLTSDLQQTPTWSELSPPGCRHSFCAVSGMIPNDVQNCTIVRDAVIMVTSFSELQLQT